MTEDQPKDTGSMETMSEALERLRSAGYETEWDARGGRLVCGRCGTEADPEQIDIDEVVRFEGASDPDDEAILFALSGACGHRGTYLAPYGPEAAPDDVTVMVALARRSR